MAAADYYLCDVCECKTFYDANLDYDEMQNCNPTTGHVWPMGNVGHMIVLCKECVKTHRVIVERKI